MNRRSPASMMNPAPTGADCVCAWTRGVYIGVPMPEASIATIVTIDHGFAERMRRHVRGLEALISDPRFKKRLSNGLTYESTSQRSTPQFFHEPVAARPVVHRRTTLARLLQIGDAARDCGNVLGVTEAGREGRGCPTRTSRVCRIPG